MRGVDLNNLSGGMSPGIYQGQICMGYVVEGLLQCSHFEKWYIGKIQMTIPYGESDLEKS